MLNKKKTIVILVGLILVIVLGAYFLTSGGVLLSKTRIDDQTLSLKENNGAFGFTTNEKYGVTDTINGKFIRVTLESVEITDYLGNLSLLDIGHVKLGKVN